MNLKSKNLLIIESSFAKSKVGLYESGKLTIKKGYENQKNSDYLLDIINDLLSQKYILGNQKLSAIVLSSGPGSFTAMRVGVSIAKALSYSFNLPIIPICSLKATCQSAINLINRKNNQSFIENQKIKLTTLMDARARGIYSATFMIEKNRFDSDQNQLVQTDKPKLIDIDNLESFLDRVVINNSSNCPHFLLGNFQTIYGNEIDRKLILKISQNFEAMIKIYSPDIKSMVDLAMQTERKNWQNALNFKINYIRNQVADKPKIKS